MPERAAKPTCPWALRLLPPFPAVAHRLLSLVDNDTATAAQINECIKLDPTFTAEILPVANSA
jgi:HD-like signal output (HDOD) protein